jgi:DNA-binding transcriptional LysR family regulator
MDIRSLACFIAIAEDLHFGRAAARLNLTQPALSQRIRALEDEVGTKLFQRDRRRVALTSAGVAFLGPARVAVAQAGAAKSEALRAVRGEVGRLRLGFTPIAFHYSVLPKAVRTYRIRFADVAIDLVEMSTPLLESALAAGDLDLGVLHPPLGRPGLVTRPLPDQNLVLALPTAHRLAEKSTIAIAELASEPFLMAPRAIGPSIYDRIIALFFSEGVSPRIIQEVTPMTTLTGLVAAGAGMGFVTEGIAAVARPGVVFRRVIPQAPALPMAAAWREPALSATAEAFLDVVGKLVGGKASAGQVRH